MLLPVVMMMSVLASCSGNEKDVPENPDVGYNDAKTAYDKGDYEKASDYQQSGDGRIALVYADGDIVGGKGDNESVKS